MHLVLIGAIAAIAIVFICQSIYQSGYRRGYEEGYNIREIESKKHIDPNDD